MTSDSSQEAPAASSARPAGRLPAGLLLGVLAACGAILPWLLAAGGHGLPRGASQAIVILSLALLAALALRWAWRTLGAELRTSRWAGLGLVVLAALAFAVHFVGLGFEVGTGNYGDEGIYWAAAERINAGAPLPHNFVYGHLSYYLVAWVLWLRGLFPGATAALATLLSGLRGEMQVTGLWIRSLSAACGALTTLAVFGIARRVVQGSEREALPAAQAAGLLGGALITAATVYNEITHLYISDVPAAFFATVCLYFVARLAGRETPSDYLLAGSASGLAAACKYPAGVVAVAIVGVWLWWRWRERRWSWGLLLSALAALATFLAVMPAFLVHSADAFAGQGRDVFFGLRQYAGSSWIGAAKDSNALWYGGKLLECFGLGALLLGCAGVFALRGEMRRRFWVLMVFPLVYGALIGSMTVAVKRNVLPLLPIAAALLGVGLAAFGSWLARRWPRRRLWLQASVALAALAVPAVAVVRQDLSLTRPGTREVVVDWVNEHLPPGAGIVKESFTPSFDPSRFVVKQKRYAVRVDPAELWSGRYDFVLITANAYGRFLREANLQKESQRVVAERYRALLAQPEVLSVAPGPLHLGPGFSLRRLDPPNAGFRRERDFAAAEAAFLSGPVLVKRAGALVFRAPGQSALFKEFLEAERFAVSVEGDGVSGGTLRAVTLANEPLGELSLDAPGASFRVPSRQKVFLYVQLPPGGRLRALHLRAAPAP